MRLVLLCIGLNAGRPAFRKLAKHKVVGGIGDSFVAREKINTETSGQV
jgi:hypothetical protein